MPLRIRLKVILAVAFTLAVLAWIFVADTWVGILAAAVALSYLEMIYPQWNFYGRAILNVRDRGPRAVALTFDDGPSEWTSRILDLLKSEKIHGSFFLLGQNIERHPDIAKRIEAEGHSIGYHGYSHTKFHFKNSKFIRADLDLCVAAFERAGLKSKSLVRFPHGFKNIFAVREIKRRGWHLCGWGRGVWDSKRPGVELIVKRSLQLKAGEILLLHDGDGAKSNPDRSQTVEALPQIIKGLRSKGFDFVGL